MYMISRLFYLISEETMYLIGFYSKKNVNKLIKFDYYKKSFATLKQSGINIIYFYEKDDSVQLSQDMVDEIFTHGISLKEFSDESEITDFLTTLKGKIFINTFEEQEIALTNTIKKSLGQKITDNPEIFLNKYLQREIIGNDFPETIVQYKFIPFHDIQKITIQDLPCLPCIIKPTWWVQSSWVCKIEHQEDINNALSTLLEAFTRLKYKKLFKQDLLIEEFIDGQMYTIDYYVDEDQHIFMSRPVLVKLWIDYGMDDFCNISRVISHEVETKVDNEKLQEFIKKTVVGWKIRNTFIHHEFKIDSKWIFKTIETNWRIWWFRLEMYQTWYDMDLLQFPFMDTKDLTFSLKKNVSIFTLYPKKECIFTGYNEAVLEQIYALPSFVSINKWVKSPWALVWATKNWHSRIGSIVLAHEDYEQFEKDIAFMETVYFDIITTKEII